MQTSTWLASLTFVRHHGAVTETTDEPDLLRSDRTGPDRTGPDRTGPVRAHFDPAQVAGRAGAVEPDPRRWLALAVCLVGGFMTLLDVSIVNVALPSIETGLRASQDQLQWVISGYALTFGLLLVPAGRLGDARGRRFMFMLALILFTAASALCGAAQTSTWLVGARLLQGLAGGLLTPQISALIQQLFSGRERGKAFGIFGSTIGISTAVGPVLGGVLIQAFGTGSGWRWVFYVNLPIGLVALPFALRLLPAPSEAQREKKHDLDPVGVVLLGVGVVVLLLPFVQEQQWRGALKWLLVPLALLVLGAFLAWQRIYRARGHEPLVDLSLYRRRSYAFGSIIITAYFAGFTPLFFLLTLFLQRGHGYSALLAGVSSIPFAIGSALSAVFGGRVVHRFGRKLTATGLALVGVGFAGVLVVVHSYSGSDVGWALAAPLLIAGVGSGLVISPNQAITLSQVPVERAGTAGGLLQTGQRIGSAIGIAFAGAVFFARVSATHGRGWATALERGVLVALALLVLALVLAVVDIVVDARIG